MKSTFYSVALAVFLSAVAMPVLAHGGSPLQMLKQIKSQLQLNTSQEQQWDAVLAQEKAARATARASFTQVRTALQTELAKPEPDLAAVAAVSDGVRQQNETLRKQTRDAWLALYATFTPEQKALARDTIKTGLDRMAARRAAHGAAAPAATE
jgi:Spy/CpxP family protein refolding chaperone